MGFGSWNCSYTQSEDPYALETDDNIDCLTREKKKHKSMTKRKKSCSHFSVAVSRFQDPEKSYRIFKSRNSFSLVKEKLESEINFRHTLQEHDSTEYSLQTHCLAGSSNEQKEYFTAQHVIWPPSDSYIKPSQSTSSTITKATVTLKEENVSSLDPRILPHSSTGKTSLNEQHTLNLQGVSQNSQIPHITKSFVLQKCTKSIQQNQRQQKALTKPHKFFKSRNKSLTPSHSLCLIRNSCAYHDRRSFNIEKCVPGKSSLNTNTSVFKDPYSLETENENYSYKQNKKYTYQHRSSKNRCLPGTDYPPSSKSQSNYPQSVQADDDHVTTVDKNFISVEKQNVLFEDFSAQLSNETKHLNSKHKQSPSIEAAKTKTPRSSVKENLKISKRKAAKQPSLNKISPQFKEEVFLPVNNLIVNEIFQSDDETDAVLSSPKPSKNKNLNLHHKIRQPVNHLSSLAHKGRNTQSPITTLSKKCSIGYTYVIKNTLSAATERRNSHEDNDEESINGENTETYGAPLSLDKIHCKPVNTSNKVVNKLTHKIDAAFSPVIRNLTTLSIHSNTTEEKAAGYVSITDNQKRHLICDNYLVSNKTTAVKPSLENKEFCLPETNSTVKLKCSFVSFNKNLDTELGYSHNANAYNSILTDAFDLEPAVNETENHSKKAPEDFQLSCSLQQKDSQKFHKNVFHGAIHSGSNYQTVTTVSSPEKHTMGNQMNYKENIDRKSLIRLKVKTIPMQSKSAGKTSGSETESSAKLKVNVINKKTCSPAMKRNKSFKKHIFISNQRKKSEVLYTHKWVEDTEGETETELMSPAGLLVEPIGVINTDHELEELRSPLLCLASKHTQSSEFTNTAEAVTNLKVDELDKYFTIIKNVRKSAKIKKLGELQELNDDTEYILDALQDSNPLTTRCHSALILASKCLMPEFRTHAEACGAMSKFFFGLYDAAEDQSLALCTAAIMLVLSQHQMFTDVRSNGIQLLLSLLNSCLTSEVEFKQLQNIKKKVLELCTEVQDNGFVKHLCHENITANHLASEILLSLTSCGMAYPLEDHLRDVGGIEHIVTAVNSCKTELDGFFVQWRRDLIDKLKFLHCCLKILESITDQNEENQLYLLKQGDDCFIGTIATLFRKCLGELKGAHQVDIAASAVTLELLFTILKLLINLTHNSNNRSFGSYLVARRPEIIHLSIYVLSKAINYVSEDRKFDLLALVLMFLINTVEHNTCNRKLIFEAKASDIMTHSNNKHTMNVLVELFYQQEKLARIEAFKTDAMLDEQIGSELSQESLEPSQEFIATLQEKAGQNMEYTMIASYLVLLIGYLIVDNKEYETFTRQCLPQKSFCAMVSVLEKMHNFLNLVPAISSKQDIIRTQYIIQYLKQSDEKAVPATPNEYHL